MAAPEPPPPEPAPPPPPDAAEDARLQAEMETGPSSFESLLAQAVSPPSPAKPAKRSALRRIAAAVGWLLFVIVVGGAGAAIFWRDAVMDELPQTKAAYAFLGFDLPPPGDGLRLNGVSSSRTTVDGTPALVIEGKVTNTSGGRRTVPPMRGSLRDAKDQELQAWTFNAVDSKLDAGETTTFKTEIKQPSPQATGLSINFISPAAK